MGVEVGRESLEEWEVGARGFARDIGFGTDDEVGGGEVVEG